MKSTFHQAMKRNGRNSDCMGEVTSRNTLRIRVSNPYYASIIYAVHKQGGWITVHKSWFCHENFGPGKTPGKFGLPDYYFHKKLVRKWNNGLTTNTSIINNIY